jgi:TetR/AcrR family transcriptional repressor of bet genes
MARPKNTDERRAQIVFGLMRLLPTHGFQGASTTAIAREAGLSSGLVHYHFKTKGEILIALAEHMSATLQQRYQARLRATHSSPRALLLAFLDALVEPGEDEDPTAVAAWVALGAEALRNTEVANIHRAVLDELLQTLNGLLTEALRDEGRRTDNADRLAAGLLAAAQGAYSLGVLAPDAVPPGFAAPTLRTMALAFLEGAEGRDAVETTRL